MINIQSSSSLPSDALQSDSVPSDADTGQVNTAAAEIYDGFFVPALFGQFPDLVLDHAGVGREASVELLDVGCGTGIVAMAAKKRLPAGSVAAVDPNDGMLAVARRSDQLIDWRSGIAEALPFDTDRFDHTISQFAAMFFTDRAEALAEMARVTRPGGTVTVATWSGLDRTPGYDAMVNLIADELGDDVADALRAPFVLGEAEQVAGLLAPLGTDGRVDELKGTARFASIADWVHTDIRGWTLADMVDDAAEATLLARAERELAEFVTGDGSVVFPAPALVGTVTVG